MSTESAHIRRTGEYNTLKHMINDDVIQDIYIRNVSSGNIDMHFSVVDEMAVMDNIKDRVVTRVEWRVVIYISKNFTDFDAYNPSTWLDFDIEKLEYSKDGIFEDFI